MFFALTWRSDHLLLNIVSHNIVLSHVQLSAVSSALVLDPLLLYTDERPRLAKTSIPPRTESYTVSYGTSLWASIA